MIDFLFSLPLWALAVVLNVWLIGFSLVCLWALRRWVLPHLHVNTNASLFYGAAVMQSAMVLYGLVAALTAVSVWSKHSQVSDTVSREATAIARQAILVTGLSGFLAMVLFVIVSLDRPYRGAMAIPADSYQLIYDQLMKR